MGVLVIFHDQHPDIEVRLCQGSAPCFRLRNSVSAAYFSSLTVVNTLTVICVICVVCGFIPSTLIRSAGGPLAVSFLLGSVATDAHVAPTAGAAAGLIEK